MTRAAVAGAWILCATLGVGCSNSSSTPSPDPAPGGTTSTSATAATEGWKLERTFDSGASYVGDLTAWDDIAIFGYGVGKQTFATAIGAWDTRANELKTLAETSFPNGSVGGVAFDGSNVLFVDTETVGDTSSMEPRAWKIRRVRVDGSTDEVIASSRPGGEVVAPYILAGDGRFAWTTWQDVDDPLAGRQLWEWKPGRTAPTTSATGIWLNDQAVPVRGGVVFSRTERSKQWPSGMPITDLFFRAEGSSSERQLTESGLVLSFAVDNGELTYTEATPKVRNSTARSDPFTIFRLDLESNQGPVEIESGFSAGNTTSSQDWTAWWDNKLNIRVRMNGAAQSFTIPTKDVHIPTRPSAHGDTLIAAEYSKVGDEDRVRLMQYLIE